jgi:hypothetical protein
VALLAIAFAFCDLSEDAVLCEESAAHLSECCPGFAPRFLNCDTPELVGCSMVDVQSDQARCILSRSCAQLRADGTCDRAIAQWTNPDPLRPNQQPVCR